MKRLFYKLLIPTVVGSTILPITGCCYSGEIETSGSIEIVSDIKDITVCQTESCISKPIEVKCIGSDKQELSYDLDLKFEGNEELPNWICITDKGEIQLKEGKEVGTYTFTLLAHNDLEKLSSNKSFKVNVIDDRHIIPTSLIVEMEDDKYYQYAESSTIPITITPYKYGVEEKYLINDVRCFVEVIYGYDKDLDGNDLFSCINDKTDHYLQISQATNTSYNGDYLLKITTVLAADSSVYDTKIITLHIAETREYYDSNSKCHFKRDKDDEGWKLYLVDSTVTSLLHIPSTIQNRPVVEIANNLCANSGITDLTEVILPSTISWIGDYAFAKQGALSIIEMPGVIWVGLSAFENDSLMEYRIGSIYPQFQVVGSGAFSNCSRFKINAQNQLMWIGENSFKNAGLSSFSIGENCVYIGKNCFSGCASLKSFKILTPKPPKIGGSIFSGCDLLKTIKVPVENVVDYKADSSWPYQGKTIEGI